MRFNDRRRGPTGVIFQPQIIYGAFDNTQIEIQTDVLTEPLSAVGPPKSGDLHIACFYNFNTETLQLPAFAVRMETDLPTRVHSRGVDTQLTGIVTRSFGDSVRTSMPGIRSLDRRRASSVTARIDWWRP